MRRRSAVVLVASTRQRDECSSTPPRVTKPALRPQRPLRPLRATRQSDEPKWDTRMRDKLREQRKELEKKRYLEPKVNYQLPSHQSV